MQLKWKKTRHSTISLFDKHLELECNGQQFRIPLEQIEKIHIPTGNPLFRYFSYIKLQVDQHIYKGYLEFVGRKVSNKASNENIKNTNITLSVANPPEEVLDFLDSLNDNRAKSGSERMIEETKTVQMI